MRSFIAVILVLAFVSTLTAQCANLSNDLTWGTMIVNDSTTGIIYINEDTVLCTDTYNIIPSDLYYPVLQFNNSGLSLDCNSSILQSNGSGSGIEIGTISAFGSELVSNCTVSGYYIGFNLLSSKNNTLINNSAINTSYGFRMAQILLGVGSSNNTFANNTMRDATDDSGVGFVVSSGSQNNSLIDNVVFNTTGYALIMAADAYYNNVTNMFIYNQSNFVTQYDTGGPANNLTNFTIGYNSTVGWVSFTHLNVSSLALYQYPPAPVVGTVFLQPDFVYVNDTSANSAQANVSANITVSTSNCSQGVLRDYDVPLTLAEVLDTGRHYVPLTFTCTNDIAAFGVSGFSAYAIGEEITALSISIQPSASVFLGTETNVTCNASNSEVNLTLYRNGVEVNSSFSSVQDITTLAQGTYVYECNATGNGNYTNATASDTLTVVTCTNISSPMTYTLTYDAVGYRTYAGPIDACMYIDVSDVTLNCDGYSITGDWTAAGVYYGVYTNALLTNVSIINCSVSNYTEGAYVGSAYGTLMDNDMFNNTEAGFYMVGVDNNISQNVIHNNTAYGIFTSAAERIYNNTIYDGPAASGIQLAGADYSVIFNNTIFGLYYGVYFNSAAYSNLTDNEITNNTLYGIYMSELAVTAGYNILMDNIVANNSVHQIAIDKSAANVIYNNLVNASGSQGVISSNTYEYWNISKTLGTNIIGGAYKGGNFYSNYTGVDTDGDGIGNTPYTVNNYSASAPQNAYSFQQASTGTWVDFVNTYDQDWDTYGNAASGAVGYYNFTIPAGASTASGSITIKAGGSETETNIGTDWGPDCLSTEPLQVKVAGEVNKGVVKADVYCYDYTLVDWLALGYMGTGDAAGVDVYELNATFNVVSPADSIDYLPLTNNLNYLPTVNITSIDGQANNSEIVSLTPIIIFNATDADNSTLNCTIYVDGTIAGGTNESVENSSLTSMTLNFSLTAGQTYNFTVNCSDDASTAASGAWVEAVANPTTTTTQSGNPSADEPLSIVAEDEVPTGNEMAIIVEHEGHVALPGALVTITFASETAFSGYTDPWGRVFFTPENAGLYTIRATKLGYVAANDSFTAVAPTECESSDDCKYDERCTQGACEKVPEGGCGTYSNHEWESYECCSSSDCGQGEQCTEHECVQREVPQPTGCTLDNECQQGYVCASGACILPPPVPPECVEDGDCESGFVCTNTVCVETPTPGGPEPTPVGPQRPTTQGGIGGAILNLWWLWLIIILLVAYYIYRKGREKK
jgi:parallel beta-helix repeat protein